MYVPSTELWLSHPPTPKRVCPPPPRNQRGGGWGGGGVTIPTTGEKAANSLFSGIRATACRSAPAQSADKTAFRWDLPVIQKYIILCNVNFTLYSTIRVSDHGCTLEPAPFPGPDSTCWQTDLHVDQISIKTPKPKCRLFLKIDQ